MYFRLFLVTLEHFGDVAYKRYIDLFFNYRYRGITVGSDPPPRCCPHPHDYRGIYFN